MPPFSRVLLAALRAGRSGRGRMSQFDLREWLRAADEAGELQRISGADAVLEIGAASELNYRRPHPRALLFNEIAGYRPGRRVLTSSLSSPALMGLGPRVVAGRLHGHRRDRPGPALAGQPPPAGPPESCATMRPGPGVALVAAIPR